MRYPWTALCWFGLNKLLRIFLDDIKEITNKTFIDITVKEYLQSSILVNNSSYSRFDNLKVQ